MELEGRSIKARVYEQSSPGGARPQVIGLEARAGEFQLSNNGERQ